MAPQLRVTRWGTVILSVAAIAGCSSAANIVGATPQLAAQPSALRSHAFDNASKALLYVSDDGTNEVDTFAWPKPRNALGSLPGFNEPQGGCADTAGDVFISDTGDQNVLEFNGTTLKNTLKDAGEYPVACSWNVTNGDLAVSNTFSTTGSSGSIAIYKHTSGSPKVFTSTSLSRLFAIAYDGSGNLYVTAMNSTDHTVLAELPAGSKQIQIICPKLINPSAPPSGIAWDGKYIVVSNGNGLVRIKNCKVVGNPIILNGDLSGFTIAGNRLIAANPGNSQVEIFSYPSAKLLQSLSGFNEPVAAVVSQNSKGK
jgi:hypothetical protein